MAKKKFHNAIKFIEVEDLKNNRFAFINNEILKENIAIKMQHVVFLLSLEEEYELPGAVIYSAFKTIILFTAAIIESLINYKLHELIASKRINEADIMDKEEKYPVCKEIYSISVTESICGVKKVVKSKKLSDRTDFIELNRAAKRCGLFPQSIFEKAEKIRDMRNRIHPYGLKEIDDGYTKEEINEIFLMASVIIERIEKY